MAPAAPPIPLTFEDGVVWTRELEIRHLCILMRYLMSHDFQAIDKIITPLLGTDMARRIADDNRINIVNETHPRSGARIINKALAMELLMGLLLAWLDRAGHIRSGCLTRHGLPNYFSTSGKADLIVDYPAADEAAQAFSIVAEVSIKRAVTRDHYDKQLNQALKQARDLKANTGATAPIYGLVVNGGIITTSPMLQDCYRRFLREHNLTQDSPCRVLPLYVGDFIKIMMLLEQDNSYNFDSRVLATTLEVLLAGLRRGGQDDKDWMVDRCMESVRKAKAPELDLTEPDQRPKPE